MYTNKLNLPEPFVRAIDKERYSKGDARYSVTELVKPARMGALERLYGQVIVEDVADNVWSLFGRVVHMILELSGAPETGAILEERLYATVAGVRISGAMDHCVLFPDGRLDDYKTATVWSVMGSLKWEWEAQTNLYRWLQAQNGRHVEALRIIAFLKDWSIAKARADKTGRYPEKAVVAIDVPVWEMERAEHYVRERVVAHEDADVWAKLLAHGHEPLCSDEERWRRPRKWAVVKDGQKRAIPGGLCDTEAEANYKVQALTVPAHVEERGGEPIRCIDYCSVGRAGFCSQWNEEQAQKGPIDYVDTSAFD